LVVGDPDAMDVLGAAERSLGVGDEWLSAKCDAESIEGVGIFATRAERERRR
jgi:hypothetical protein